MFPLRECEAKNNLRILNINLPLDSTSGTLSKSMYAHTHPPHLGGLSIFFFSSFERHHICTGSLWLTYQRLNWRITHQDKMTTITFALLDANKDQLFRNQLEILGNVWCLESGIRKNNLKSTIRLMCIVSVTYLTLSSACPPNVYPTLTYIFHFIIIMVKIPTNNDFFASKLTGHKGVLTYKTINHPFVAC